MTHLLPAMALTLALTTASLSAPTPFDAEFDGAVSDNDVTNSGIHRGNTKPNRGLPGKPRPGTGGGTSSDAPQLEYRTTPACPSNSPENPTSDLCASAFTQCRHATSGPGYLTYIYARPVDGSTPWVRVGKTCYPDEIGATPPRALTLADVEREFATTPFASPAVTLQPPDNHTLVDLPVYYSAQWSATGYRPGQVRTLSLLGHTVDLEIVLSHYVYEHGDGTSTGPTSSAGGPYPTGDITHRYRTAGSYNPVIRATLTARYRVDGGAWRPIAATANRSTALPPVTVHTATNRLLR